LLKPDLFVGEYLAKPAWRVTQPELVVPAMFQGGDAGFAYSKVLASKPQSAAGLQACGFRLIDTNVQLDLPIADVGDPTLTLPSGYEVRWAVENDRAGVEAVAGESFVFTRFHLDPDIPDEAANGIKAAWAGNFFDGKRGDQMAVATCKGEPVGFLQLLFADSTLIIDLIAVAGDHQGNKLASAMIQFAAQENASLDRYLVGTQIANTPSLRAYEKLGFRVCDASYVFHYHGPINPEAAA